MRKLGTGVTLYTEKEAVEIIRKKKKMQSEVLKILTKNKKAACRAARKARRAENELISWCKNSGVEFRHIKDICK